MSAWCLVSIGLKRVAYTVPYPNRIDIARSSREAQEWGHFDTFIQRLHYTTPSHLDTPHHTTAKMKLLTTLLALAPLTLAQSVTPAPTTADAWPAPPWATADPAKWSSVYASLVSEGKIPSTLTAPPWPTGSWGPGQGPPWGPGGPDPTKWSSIYASLVSEGIIPSTLTAPPWPTGSWGPGQGPPWGPGGPGPGHGPGGRHWGGTFCFISFLYGVHGSIASSRFSHLFFFWETFLTPHHRPIRLRPLGHKLRALV